jgi:hypothetical protein
MGEVEETSGTLTSAVRVGSLALKPKRALKAEEPLDGTKPAEPLAVGRAELRGC